MKKRVQQLLSALLASCMIIGLFALPVSAAETPPAGTGSKENPWDISAGTGTDNVKAWFEGNSQDGYTLYISGEGRMTDSFYAIDPPWKSMRNNIAAVKIEEGVSNVGAYAFNFCKSLSAVSLPESLTEIGTYAFHATSVKHLAIPSDVNIIGRMIATPNTYYEVLGNPESVNDHAFSTSLVSVTDSVTAAALNAKTNVSAIIVLNGGIYGETDEELANLSYGLITPKKEGFAFDGWYKTADFSGTRCVQDSNGRTAININNIYYAKWTDEITPTPEATPSVTPEVTPSITPEATPSITPEATSTPTPEATPSITPEATPTPAPEPTLPIIPEVTPTPLPWLTPSITPETTPTPTLEATPSTTPKATPTPAAEATPAPMTPVNNPIAVVETMKKDDLFQVEVTLSEKDTEAILAEQEALGEEEVLEVSIIIPENVTDVSDDIKDVIIDVRLPAAFAESKADTIFILPEKLIENAKENEVNLTVKIYDSSQDMQVAWRFDAGQLASSEEIIDDIYLMVSSGDASDANISENAAAMLDKKAEIIDFAHTGILPAPAEISIKTGYAENTIVYLYYYNEEKGCLDEVPANKYSIGANSIITFQIAHCSKYVLSSKKLGTARSLEEQIEVLAGTQNLYVGGTIGDAVNVQPALPATLKKAEDLSIELAPALMAVKFTYASSKPSVARVDKNGIVAAAKSGSATIQVTAELANGTVKTFQIPIKVSRASVKMIWTKQAYTVGSQIHVSAELKGYDPADIRWMTSRRGIAVVRKFRGKTDAVVKAMDAGTDWIVIYSKDQAILRTKVVITEAPPEEVQ